MDVGRTRDRGNTGQGGHEEGLGLLGCKENKGRQKLKGEGIIERRSQPKMEGGGWQGSSHSGVLRGETTRADDLADPQLHNLVLSEPCLSILIPSGPPAPRHLHARALSDSEIQLTWQRPEAPAGPISKYIVEVQVAGGSGDPLWMDVDRPEETNTIVRGLNASTRYLFRVRASVQGPGDWSKMVEESTLGNGERAGTVGTSRPWGQTQQALPPHDPLPWI